MSTEETSPAAPAPTVAELQSELASAREDLLSSWNDLTAELNPQALIRRAGDSAKGWFTDDFGGPRIDRIGIVAGAVVGVIALRALLRRR